MMMITKNTCLDSTALFARLGFNCLHSFLQPHICAHLFNIDENEDYPIVSIKFLPYILNSTSL